MKALVKAEPAHFQCYLTIRNLNMGLIHDHQSPQVFYDEKPYNLLILSSISSQTNPKILIKTQVLIWKIAANITQK